MAHMTTACLVRTSAGRGHLTMRGREVGHLRRQTIARRQPARVSTRDPSVAHTPPLHAVLDLQRRVGNATVTLILQRDGEGSQRQVKDPGPTIEAFTAANPGIVAALSGEQLRIWHQVVAGWAANRQVDEALRRHEKGWRATSMEGPTSTLPIASSDYLRAHERIESRRKWVDEQASRATLDPKAILSADINAAQQWNVAAENRYRTWAVEHFGSKPLVAELTTKREIVSALEESQTAGLASGIPHVNVLWGGQRIRHTKGIVGWDDLQSITEFRDVYRKTVIDSPEIQALRDGIRDIASHITTMETEHEARSEANRGEPGDSGGLKQVVRGGVRRVSESLGAPSAIEVTVARLRVQQHPNDTDALANLAEVEGRTQNYPKRYDDKGGPGIWHDPDLQLSAARRFLKEGKFELAVAALTQCEHSTAIATAKFAGYERRVMKGASTAVTWLERAKTAGKIASAFTGTGGVVRAAIGAAGYTFAQEGSQQVVAHWMDESNKIDLAGLVQQSAIEGLATLLGGVTQGAFVKALENRYLGRLIKSGLSESTARGALGLAGATTASFYNVPAQIVLKNIIAGEAIPTSLGEVADMITGEVALAPVMELAGRYVHAESTPGEPKPGTHGEKEIAPPQELVEALSRPVAHEEASTATAGRPAQAGPGGRPVATGTMGPPSPGTAREVHTVGPSADGIRLIRETEAGDLVVCQRCARISDEYKPEMKRDETLRDREAAVKQIPPGSNHDAAALRLEAELFQQRQSQLAKLSEATLKKRIGTVDAPKDVTALAELTRRFEERPRRDLVEMMRRDSKFNGPIAAEVLARGKGRPGTHAEYEAYMNQGGSLDLLRDAARFDEAAMYELVGRYRQLPPAELERLRAAGDPIADQISTQPDRGPRMDPAADARLAEAMWERRRTAIEQAEAQATAAQGVRARQRADRAVAQATHEGTIGTMETDIPGIAQIEVRGSPHAPQGTDPAPSADRRYQPPPGEEGTPLPESAHHHAEDKLVNLLDGRIRDLNLTQRDLAGRTVRISVDQGVCQTCAAGVAGGRQGVLLRFSGDHPGLRIEVTDVQTGTFSVYEGGVRTVHHERTPTYAEPRH
jgi:hypothetical protein